MDWRGVWINAGGNTEHTGKPMEANIIAQF